MNVLSWFDRIPGWARRIGELSTALLATISIAAYIRNWYLRTIGRRRDAYRRLSRLGTNAQLSYFTAVLGEPPALRRTTQDIKVQSILKTHFEVSNGYKEHIYVARDFYVQAITDSDETVLAYSVTSRSLRFRPRFRSPGQQHKERPYLLRRLGLKSGYVPIFDMRLQKGRFDLLPAPAQVLARLGARRYRYSEAHWLGNPGYYQWYVFSVNDAGPSSFDAAALQVLIDAGDQPGPEQRWGFRPGNSRLASVPELLSFRRRSRPNTYAVIGSYLEIESFLSLLGVDADIVRTFS